MKITVWNDYKNVDKQVDKMYYHIFQLDECLLILILIFVVINLIT